MRCGIMLVVLMCVVRLHIHSVGGSPVQLRNAEADPMPITGGDTKSKVMNILLANLPKLGGDDKVNEVSILVSGEKGMDDRGVFQPAGYEIKEKITYDKSSHEKMSALSGPVYPYGLGNVVLGGCFGTNYNPGDPCYSLKTANSHLCLDLLDGAMFMGVGFDARETYSAESQRKGLLQRSCREKRRYHEKDVPDNLVAQGIYEYNIKTSAYSSVSSYQRELVSRAGIALTGNSFSKEMRKISAGASGGAFGYSASVQTSFSGGRSESQKLASSSNTASQSKGKSKNDVFIAVLEADLLVYEIFQDSVRPDDLRWEFVREFMALPTSYYNTGAIPKYQDFIQRWGTHYVRYSKFGGQLKMIKKKKVPTATLR